MFLVPSRHVKSAMGPNIQIRSIFVLQVRIVLATAIFKLLLNIFIFFHILSQLFVVVYVLVVLWKIFLAKGA